MKKMFIVSFSMIALLFMLAGCSQSPFATNSTNSSNHTTDTEYEIDLSTFPFGKTEPTEPTEPTEVDVATTNSTTTPDTDLSPVSDSHEDTSEPVTESTSDSDPTNDSSSNDKNNSEPEIENSLDSQPRLIGYTVGDSLTEVRDHFGTPKEQYVMDDTEGKIQVDLYKGFTIGYNSSNRIEFIDVYEPAVDPQLDGVQIGQHISDAIHTLGKPSSQSEFVVNYLVDGVYLKFDIDPGSQTILTIKLFKSE